MEASETHPLAFPTSSSSSYEDYEQEYESYLSQIRAHLASGQLQPSTVSDCESTLAEARRCVHAMQGLAEIENDSLKITTAKNKLEREIGPLTKEIAHQKEVVVGRGRNWFGTGSGGGGGGGGSSRSSKETRTRAELFQQADLLDSGVASSFNDTESLLTNSERLLADSQRLVSDSEEIGGNVLNRMGSQREQLEMASRHLEGTMSYTHQARGIMKEMGYRAVRNKIFLYTVIAFLVLANGIVLYKIIFK